MFHNNGHGHLYVHTGQCRYQIETVKKKAAIVMEIEKNFLEFFIFF